ncbi:MAG: phosphatase PAP2 family protein [Candidatus Magnetominusculus sp. LBB02]|nr:phosphatase PAP2 family protein [Candidatus Magnetominusculus sp. LBB02]
MKCKNMTIGLSWKQLMLGTLLLVVLAWFFLAGDKWTINLIKSFLFEHSTIDAFLKNIDPVCNFLIHGATQFAAAFILFIIGRYLYRPLFIPGKAFLFSLTAVGLTVQVIKHLVGRARPRITETFIAIGPSLNFDYDSFPSGHTAMAFSIAFVISSLATRFRGLYSVVFYLYAVLAGFDRVRTGSHFPSDVIAGALVGMAVTKMLLPMLTRSTDKTSSSTSQP